MTRVRELFGIAVALVVAFAAASPALAGKKDNSVVFATQYTLGSLDPYFNELVFGTSVADQIWDTLIYSDSKTVEYKGNLATSWKWLDDRTLELELRRGVRFHNGAEFDADDVVYTLNFVINPQSRSTSFSTTQWIDHVEKVDRFKVRIATKQPFPAALAYLATPRMAIYPHDYYAKVGPKGMNERPVGTGPYRVVEHALGKHIRLERNRDYFKDSPKSQPKIDRIEIRFVPDAQTRVAEILSGGLDLISDVALDQAEQLRDVRGLQVVSGDTVGYVYLGINIRKDTPAPQLRDIRVRQAIMYAIDRETISKYLAGESARVLHTECHPVQFGCTDQGVPRYAYDPQKARQLLADAGYPKGFSVDLYASSTGRRNETEAIIGYLRAVGINARLRALQTAAVASAVQAGRVGLVSLGWTSDIADVSSTVSVFHGFTPLDLSRDEDVRVLLARGDSSLDPDARKKAYTEAFRTIGERAYVLPLHSLPNYYLAAEGLTVIPHTDGVIRFYEMSWK